MASDVIYRDKCDLRFTDSADVVWAKDGYLFADPLFLCPSCKNLFLEDPRMYENTDICPNCGAALSGLSKFNKEDLFNG
jgi:uncharacterized CHY-type Zn-finger protein